MSDLQSPKEARDIGQEILTRLSQIELPEDPHELEHWLEAGAALQKAGKTIVDRVKAAAFDGSRPAPRNYSVVGGAKRREVTNIGGLFDAVYREIGIDAASFLRTACSVNLSGVESLFVSHSSRDTIPERKQHCQEVLAPFVTMKEGAKQLKSAGASRRDNQPDVIEA